MRIKRKTRKATAANDTLDTIEGQPAASFGEATPRGDDDKFTALFADWLRARADIDQPRAYSTDKEAAVRNDRADDLTRLLIVTPVPQPWMIWKKFDVLEHYLNFYGEGSTGADNREFLMVASIKADLVKILNTL